MSRPEFMSHPFESRSLVRFLQLLLWSLAIFMFVWAFSDSRFRDNEGFLEGTFGLPISIGIALLVLGWAMMVGRLRRFAFWFALALVGQAVALQLIEAGPELRYQHYQPFNHLLIDTHPLLLVFLAIQAVLVGVSLSRRWSQIWSWVRQTFKIWQLLGVGLIFFLSSATVSHDVSVYVAELIFAAFVQTVNLGAIVLMTWSLPVEKLAWPKQRFEEIFGRLKQDDGVGEPGGLDRFATLAAFWVIALAAVLNIYSYQQHPHVADEVAYLYHARYLANGVLTMPAPPVLEGFELYLMQVDGDRWYPSPPPGWPAILAVGVRFGAPWLVNPVLAGLNILVIYLLLREIYSRRTARIVLLLLCISPWYIFMAMNFMNHMLTLTCALVASLGVAWARRTGNATWAWLGGLALGMMALIRPLEAVAIAGLVGLWAIGIGGSRLKTSAIIGLVVGALITGAIVPLYNILVTGDPTVFPIMAYTDRYFGPNANALGFGPDRGMGWAIDPYPGHSPRDALINANLNAFSINIELFGWSIGSLIIAGVMVLYGPLRRSDYLMLAVIVTIFVPHFFYYFSGGPDFGARYWFLMLIPIISLTARGIQVLERRFETAVAGPNIGTRVMVAVMSMCIFTLVNYFPWRAIDKYHHYLDMRPDIRSLAEEYNFGRSLVLIRGNQHPDYASAAIYNPLDLYADETVYAWDRNPELRDQILNAYPDRFVWTVNGPSLSKRGFEVIEGPLPARVLIAQEKEEQ